MHVKSTPSIATIINFCTNDARFITACIEQCRMFSRQIIIPVCSSFFDGTAENCPLLEAIFASFPDCQFIEYPLLTLNVSRRWPFLWPSVSRVIAYTFLDKEIEHALFLDADEVPEGGKLLEWFKSGDYAQYSCLNFSNYWYFRSPHFQATTLNGNIILANRRNLKADFFLHKHERNGMYALMPSPKKAAICGWDGQPMFHHFSWVRTKEEMLKKVTTWGHCFDRDWCSLVEEEFKAPFKGKDFVHGYSYKVVESPFSVDSPAPEFTPKGPPCVHRLTAEEWLERFMDFRSGL